MIAICHTGTSTHLVRPTVRIPLSRSRTGQEDLFTAEERLALMRETTSDLANVRVEAMDGLLVDFARDHGAAVLVKGIRFASDFDFELQMAHINGIVGGVETVVLPASAQWSTLSSTMIREVAGYGGDVSALVPEAVSRQITHKRRKEAS